MEKYGVIPESLKCESCKGDGCDACNQTGRASGKIEPEKEAQVLKEERKKDED